MVDYKDTGRYEQVEDTTIPVYVGADGQVDFSGKSTRVDDNFTNIAQNISNGQAYTGGDGISVVNNVINLKYDNDTLKLNNGILYVPTISYNSLSDKLTAGDNITIVNNRISATNTTYDVATSSTAGLMSALDKQKLDASVAYELPVAATNILGGIKPDGTTITVTETGVASAVTQPIAEATTSTAGLMSASDKAKLNAMRVTANYIYAGSNGYVSVNDTLNGILVYTHPAYTPLNISPEAGRILNGITVDSTGHVTSIHYTTASGITVEDETTGSVITDITADDNTLSVSRDNIGDLEIGAVDTVTDAITYPIATDSVKTSLRKLWNKSNTKLTYKGTIGTGGTVPSLPTNPSVGDVYKALATIDIGGSTAENGDLLIYDNNLGGWSIITSGIRPDSNTWRPISINGVPRFDGSITSGLLNIAQGANVTITYSDGTVTINSTGSGGSSTYGPGTGIEFITVSDIDTINIKKATASSLGGVKVGAGLNVDSNGGISVAYGNTSTTAAAGNHTHSEYAAASHTHTYDSITNKPSIPTVNDATITITQGGTTKGTFTLNQSTNSTIALDSGGGTGNYTFSNPLVNNNNVISLHYVDNGDVGSLSYTSTNGLYVPGTCFTASDGVVLSNYNFSADFGGNGTATTVSRSDHTHTYASITNKPQLKAVATSGSYNDLSDKPTIPTVTWRPITVNSHTLLSSSEADALTITGSGVTYNDDTKSINITSSSSGTTYQAGNGININQGTTPNTISVKYDDSTIKRFTSGADVGKLYVPTATTTTPGVVQFGSDSNTAATGNHNHAVESLTNVNVNNLQDGQILRYSDYDAKWQNYSLATVATTGSYTDLSNKPTISTYINNSSTVEVTDSTGGAGKELAVKISAASGNALSEYSDGLHVPDEPYTNGDATVINNKHIDVQCDGTTIGINDNNQLYVKNSSSIAGTKLVTVAGNRSIQHVIDGAYGLEGDTRGNRAVDLQIDRFANSQVASGFGAVTMGAANTASGTCSVAMGERNIASIDYSVALGYYNYATGMYSTASGRQNSASGSCSIAMGEINSATGDQSVAIGGYLNDAIGKGCVATGVYNNCDIPYAVTNNDNTRGKVSGTNKYGNAGFFGIVVDGGSPALFKLSNTDMLIARIDLLPVSEFIYTAYPVSFFITVYGNTIRSCTLQGDTVNYTANNVFINNGYLRVNCGIKYTQIGVFYTLFKSKSGGSGSGSGSGS